MNSISDNQKKEYEEHFHDGLLDDEQHLRLQFYDDEFMEYIEKEAHQYLGNIKGKSLLYYGCGVNWSKANTFCEEGSHVTMIDISGASIEFLKKKVKEMNQEGSIVPIRMDCENLDFDDNTFDVIYGRAIIHHLDLDKSLAEVSRVLKPGGRIVFIEPLGMNPFINLFRKMTPSYRTPYEHPLIWKDLKNMEKYFNNVKHEEYTLITLFGVAINTISRVFKWKSMPLKGLRSIDAILLNKIPALRKYCWNTILCLEK